MSPIRTLVVDDEPLARERVCDLVRASHQLELIGAACNGLEALAMIEALTPELLLMDIEMPELDGFGVIAALDPARVPAVVFITAFEHYALKAFDVGALDYLHKPVTSERFSAAVARASERLLSGAEGLIAAAALAERARGFRKQFVVRRANAYYFVAAADVDWIDVADNYLQLHVAGRTHLSRGTMKDVDAVLDPAQFVRVHRSLIVAIGRMVSVRAHQGGGYEIEMACGAMLRSSRQYSQRLRESLGLSGIGI